MLLILKILKLDSSTSAWHKLVFGEEGVSIEKPSAKDLGAGKPVRHSLN